MNRRGEDTIRTAARRRAPQWAKSETFRAGRSFEQLLDDVVDAVFAGARVEDAWRAEEPLKKNPR